MVINPTAPVSPINLVTAGASVMLASKLASGDANNAIQILGSGEIDMGPGGGAALDTVFKRSSARIFQVGNGGGGFDLLIGQSGAGPTIDTTGDTHIYLRGNGGNLLILTAAGVFQNPTAANEVATATAGAAGAPPAQVKGYLVALDHTGTSIKIPYYAN